jgi:hypothetical protein
LHAAQVTRNIHAMSAVATDLPMYKARGEYMAWRQLLSEILLSFGLRAQLQHLGEEVWLQLYEDGLSPQDAVLEQGAELV